MRHRFTAQHATRLDRLVTENTPLSRRRARAVIGAGAVRVDGRICRQGATTISQGVLIEVRDVAQNTEMPTIRERYRDAHLLVVDKPTGLPTQGTRTGDDMNLFATLQTQETYVGLHHRLDTPASGLVLFTLSKAANPAIANGFRTASIHRRYQVAVVGDPGASGIWDEPLDGRQARSHWQRLAYGDGIGLLEVRLETGRTHQIRRHAAMNGHPILGDRRHGGAAGRSWNRLALHAIQLNLTHPVESHPLEVRSEIPPDLQDLWNRAHPQCSPTT